MYMYICVCVYVCMCACLSGQSYNEVYEEFEGRMRRYGRWKVREETYEGNRRGFVMEYNSIGDVKKRKLARGYITYL